MARNRLTADDWIDAALEALAEQGHVALGAEPLARAMGATKGSFYWHFKDLPDFHEKLTGAWKRRAAAELVTVLEDKAPLPDRLRRIALNSRVGQAMRAWALSNASAADAVAEIDTLRTSAIAALLQEAGISNPALARIIYSAGIGLSAQPGLAAKEADAAFGELVDMVLALQ